MLKGNKKEQVFPKRRISSLLKNIIPIEKTSRLANRKQKLLPKTSQHLKGIKDRSPLHSESKMFLKRSAANQRKKEILSDINMTENNYKTILTESGILSANNIAAAIQKDLERKYKILVDTKNNMFYVYMEKTGSFQAIADGSVMDTFIRKAYDYSEAIDEVLRPAVLKEVRYRFLTNPNVESHCTRQDFDRMETLINTLSGVVDIEQLDVYPYDHRYRFLSTVPVHYSPAHKPVAEQFNQYLRMAFPEKDNKDFLLEVMGYLISNIIGLKISTVFIGVGGSGKSMLLKLISLFVGEDAVISTPLQDFTKPFALAEFATRRLNLVGELDIKKISESGMIKSIIGQDIITVNRKFKTQETFRATIKQVFAANQMPIVADNIKSDKAFFKRFQFISFEHEISTKDVISNYEQKLFQEEKDGIFWILVEALHKFHARGCKFNLSKQAKRLRDEFQNTHSPIESFLTECVVLDKTLSISSQVLYDAYEEYVMNKTLLCWEEKEMTIKRFIKAFQDFTKIKSSKIWFSQCNKSLQGFKGVGLKM